MKRWLLILVVAVAVAAVAAPWWSGVQAERIYADQLRELEDRGVAKVAQSSFQRGWFQSSARSELELSDSPFTVSANHQIRHGPFPRLGSATAAALRPAYADVVTEATLRLSGDHGAVWSTPLTAHTTITWNGDGDTRLRVAPSAFEDSDGTRLSWQAVEGELILRAHDDTVSGSLRGAGAVLDGPRGNLAIGPYVVTFTSPTADNGLSLGTSALRVDTLTVTNSGRPPLRVDGLALTTDASVGDDSVSYRLAVAFAALGYDSDQLGPGRWELALDDVDADSVRALARRDGDTGATPWLEGLQRIVARRPRVDSTLEVSTDDGPVSATLELRLAENVPLPSLFAALSALRAELRARAPKPVVIQAAALLMERTRILGRSEAGASADSVVQQWVDNGFLIADPDHYRIGAVYEGGQLSINGAPLTLSPGIRLR